MTNLYLTLKTRDITLQTKVRIVKAMVFPIAMHGCGSWTVKKAKHWRIDVFVVLKTLESPLDWKEIKPVNPKGNQSWIFIGRTDAEAEAPIFWSPDAKSWLIKKDPDTGKDWRQEEKGTTEDEMIGWHHWLDGDEFGEASGDGEGEGNLVLCSPWDGKESEMTEQLNNNNFFRIHCLKFLFRKLIYIFIYLFIYF